MPQKKLPPAAPDATVKSSDLLMNGVVWWTIIFIGFTIVFWLGRVILSNFTQE